MIFILTLAVSAVLPLPNYLFLRNSGEVTPIPQVVKDQQRVPVLYGAGFGDNTYRYKLELIRERRPDIVTLGSSRVFFFQQEAFRRPFVNAGGGARSVREARLFLEDLVKTHSPKVLVVGLDYFWFNKAYLIAPVFPEHDFEVSDITRFKLLQPLLWIKQGRYSFVDYERIFTGRSLQNRLIGYTPVGFFAMVKGNGFRADGSHVNSIVCSGGEGSADKGFKSSLGLLTSNGWGLSSPNEIDPARLNELAEFAAACDRYGIRPVFYLTPVSPIAYDRLQSDPNAADYLRRVRAALPVALGGHEFYDTFDIRSMGSNDCESIDAHHPGNVAQDRILRWMADANPRGAISEFIDRPAIDRMISIFAGQAMVFSDPQLIKFNEVDFHEIGCVKKTKQQLAELLNER